MIVLLRAADGTLFIETFSGIYYEPSREVLVLPDDYGQYEVSGISRWQSDSFMHTVFHGGKLDLSGFTAVYVDDSDDDD